MTEPSVTIILRPEQVRDFVEGWKNAAKDVHETDIVNLAVKRGKKQSG